MAKQPICSIEGCGKPHSAKGYCRNHYRRWKAHGDPFGGRIYAQKEKTICIIPGCGMPSKGRGWCNSHYTRWRRHGTPLGGTATPGAPAAFLLDIAIPFNQSECLLWPFGKDRRGYGHIDLQDRGRTKLAHRLVCTLVHGAPATPNLEAAHNCGNSSCVNPRHLRWATPKENQSDKIKHGTTNRGERCATSRLTKTDVIQIRELALTMKQVDIAAKFGVSSSAIRHIIRRKNWGWLP